MTIQEYNEHPGISASAIKTGRASMMQMHYAMTTPLARAVTTQEGEGEEK